MQKLTNEKARELLKELQYAKAQQGQLSIRDEYFKQALECVPQWIACSERMPEQFKAILVFNEYGEVWSGAYDKEWAFFCDNEEIPLITHWMTLPEAPL